MSKTYVCETCGAAVTSDRCELCGTPVSKPVQDEAVRVDETLHVDDPFTADEDNHRPKTDEAAAPSKPVSKLVCATCGAANRSDARFCDQCGEELEQPDIVAKPKAPPVKSVKAASRQEDGSSPEEKPKIGLYVAGAIAAVVALYLISVLTGNPSSEPSPPPQDVASTESSGGDVDSYLPEDAGLAGSLSETKDQLEAATDPGRRQALLEELVQSYAGAGRLDLAGREQEKLAAEVNSAEAWATAGNLHFDWMEGQSGPERVRSAQRASKAYEKALELDPDNLDVRTDLGVAYLNDPSSPMLAIQNTNMVLDVDSNHVQANFNKGVMLAQIGRTDEAVRLFRKVTQLSSPGQPAHERAKQVLSQLGASPTSVD